MPEDEDEFIGYRIRGKNLVSKSAENLKINLKKSLVAKHLNEASLNVTEVKTIPYGVQLQYYYEVNKEEEKGLTLVKIYGPYKKKNNYQLLLQSQKNPTANLLK